MANDNHKKRNQILKMARAKGKLLEKGFGITKEDKKRAVAFDYVIDTAKKTPGNDNPRMTD